MESVTLKLQYLIKICLQNSYLIDPVKIWVCIARTCLKTPVGRFI